jgi:hypothetical protein
MGNKSRDKGIRYRQKIAAFYRELGYHAYAGEQSRKGSDAPDVVIRKLDYLDMWIECKHYARGVNVFAAYDQANEAAGDQAPCNVDIVVHAHIDNGPDLVVIDLPTWKYILEQLEVR